MSHVYYRIVTEEFASEPGQSWPVEVLIQTEDPRDFPSFEEACDEVLDRIQERIDREEDRAEPDSDSDYLDKLQQMFSDTRTSDWAEYCLCVTQPQVIPHKKARTKPINLAEVAGRRRLRRLIERGKSFESSDLNLLRLLEEQARVGKRVVKRKRKQLKARKRPTLSFDCVRIDPRLAQPSELHLIQSLLHDHHLRRYEEYDWRPSHTGFTSYMPQRGRVFTLFTVFLEYGGPVTFVGVSTPGEELPDLDELMERATVAFSSEKGLPLRQLMLN